MRIFDPYDCNYQPALELLKTLGILIPTWHFLLLLLDTVLDNPFLREGGTVFVLF